MYNTEDYINYSWITYCVEIALLLILANMGGGDGTKFLLYITLADCYIVWGASYGVIAGIIYFLFNIAQYTINYSLSVKGLLLVIGNEAPVFFLVALIAFLVERFLKSAKLIEISIKNLEEREVKLKSAYDELNKAYESLEEMSTIKERNRIAREIHDTVGHTITTVIVEMEAGRMLADKNINLAMEKYNMAQSQAFKSLEELRRSVRMLTDENQNFDLKEALLDVIEETEVHAGITVKSIIDIPENIDAKYSNIIIRALKEGFANGIRHGGATAYFFKLIEDDHSLIFQLHDNGTGCDKLNLGFGLENMAKVIHSLGGEIRFNSEPGEGFEIDINMPMESKGMEVYYG